MLFTGLVCVFCWFCGIMDKIGMTNGIELYGIVQMWYSFWHTVMIDINPFLQVLMQPNSQVTFAFNIVVWF